MRLPVEMCVAAFMAEGDLDAVRDLLQDEGITIFEASHADELKSSAAPVILLDADACQDWLRTLQQVHEQRPDGRIVVLSRLADNRMWIEILRYGAFDLLAKPYRRQ